MVGVPRTGPRVRIGRYPTRRDLAMPVHAARGTSRSRSGNRDERANGTAEQGFRTPGWPPFAAAPCRAALAWTPTSGLGIATNEYSSDTSRS